MLFMCNFSQTFIVNMTDLHSLLPSDKKVSSPFSIDDYYLTLLIELIHLHSCNDCILSTFHFRCKTYTNIPEGCRLEKVNECCSEVVCPNTLTADQGTSTFITKTSETVETSGQALKTQSVPQPIDRKTVESVAEILKQVSAEAPATPSQQPTDVVFDTVVLSQTMRKSILVCLCLVSLNLSWKSNSTIFNDCDFIQLNLIVINKHIWL